MEKLVLSNGDLDAVLYYIGYVPRIIVTRDGELNADPINVVIPYKFLKQITDYIAYEPTRNFKRQFEKIIMTVEQPHFNSERFPFHITPEDIFPQDPKKADLSSFMKRGGCAICMQAGTNIKMRCGCNFHKECVEVWLNTLLEALKKKAEAPDQTRVNCVLCKKPWNIVLTRDGRVLYEMSPPFQDFVPLPPGPVIPHPKVLQHPVHHALSSTRAAGGVIVVDDDDDGVIVVED